MKLHREPGNEDNAARRSNKLIMTEPTLLLDSLVLYKDRPARIARVGKKKVTIKISGQQTLEVRYKDIVFLHQGPIQTIDELAPLEGELEAAWELLAGQTTTLEELAELLYGDFSPDAAWSTWLHITDGLYFKGDTQSIWACTPEEVEREKESRKKKRDAEIAWQAFIQRLEQGDFSEADRRYLSEVEFLANGWRDSSRVLKALGSAETPEQAHDLLLRIGYWSQDENPFPRRLNITLTSSEAAVDLSQAHERADLTHLDSFAIDDEGSNDPDDALSLDGDRLWVHVADPASVVLPDSPADRQARERGANLYLPEGTITMLPHDVVEAMALGLAEVSPALSFGLDLSDSAQVQNMEIVPSWIKVTRLSYETAETGLADPTLSRLYQISLASRRRRLEHGAIELNLPEVKIRLVDGTVQLKALESLRSRELVREAMLMVGEAVARYAQEKELPIPYTMQDPPYSPPEMGESLAQMFAVRNSLRPGRKTGHPAPHHGLGLEFYAQATSPLRRYLDLVVHQQLRAHLAGARVLGADEITERIGYVESVMGSLRQAERQSNWHWTLVYLLQNPDWMGKGIIVDQNGSRFTCLIPELGLDTGIYMNSSQQIGSEIELKVRDIRLAYQEVHFDQV